MQVNTMFNMNKNSAPILNSHLVWKTFGALLPLYWNCIVL